MCSPWGRCEWKGRWGDESATWLLHAKKAEELGIEAERSDDGKFWMAVTGGRSYDADCTLSLFTSRVCFFLYHSCNYAHNLVRVFLRLHATRILLRFYWDFLAHESPHRIESPHDATHFWN